MEPTTGAFFSNNQFVNSAKKEYHDYTPGYRTERFKLYSRKVIYQSITEPSPQCPTVVRSHQIIQLFAHPGKTSTKLVLKLKHQSRFKIQKDKQTWVNLLRKERGRPLRPPPWFSGFWQAKMRVRSCWMWKVRPSSGTNTSPR